MQKAYELCPKSCNVCNGIENGDFTFIFGSHDQSSLLFGQVRGRLLIITRGGR